MSTRKPTKKKVFDLVQGREYEIDMQAPVPEYSELDLAAPGKIEPLRIDPVVEYMTKYEHLDRTRDMTSILMAILRELVAIRVKGEHDA